MARFLGERSEVSNKLREILETPPISRGRAPRWVLQAVKEAIKDGKLPEADCALTSGAIALEYATCAIGMPIGQDWSDHSGVLKWNGHELLVCEPYAEKVSAAMLSALEQFTEMTGTTYVMSANSEHYPGRTIRIVIGSAGAVGSYRRREWKAAQERQALTVADYC